MKKGELVYYKDKNQTNYEDKAVIVCGIPKKDGTIKVALGSHDGKITYQLVPVSALRLPSNEDIYGYPHQQIYKGDSILWPITGLVIGPILLGILFYFLK